MYFRRVGIALSVLLNVIVNGYSNQTFSARNWGLKLDNKLNMALFIDLLFNSVAGTLNICTPKTISFDFSNHCERSWNYWVVRKNMSTSEALAAKNDLTNA